MVRRAPVAGEARVYDISGQAGSQLGPSLALGVRQTAAQKKARRKELLAKRETELLDSFEFPTFSTRVKETRDGRYIFASGMYPPQIHVYDTSELSMKFKRHVNSEIVDFQVLEDDWKKFALLSVDRYVDLHSPYGSHFKTRVPLACRDMLLHRGTADLYLSGCGGNVWRLNLSQGRFLAPVNTGLPNVNVSALAPPNRLLAFGGDNGVVQIWDSRVVGAGAGKARAAGSVDVMSHVREKHGNIYSATKGGYSDNNNNSISAVRFDERDGVTMGVGTASGHTLMYDLRSSKPFMVRDQGFGLPVHTLRLLDGNKHVLSSDAKSIKVWARDSGKNFVSIEPDADVNHVCVVGRSGVLCAAVEAPRVRSYYVPSLGTAPKWCAFLDTFTEELEDVAGGSNRNTHGILAGEEENNRDDVFANYKFVPSREKLQDIGLGNLIGTDTIKPMAHGFFVPTKLYRQAVEASEPFAYEKYRLQKAQEEMERTRESRISKVRTNNNNRVKVNKKLAERLEANRGKGRKAQVAASIMEDPRFAAMFEKSEFRVDEDAERFRQLNPSGVGGNGNDKAQDDDSDEEYLEEFTLVDEEGRNRENNNETDDSCSESESESEAEKIIKYGPDGKDGNADGPEKTGIRKEGRSKKKRISNTRMYEIESGGEVVSGNSNRLLLQGGRTKMARRRARKEVRDKVSLKERLGI